MTKNLLVIWRDAVQVQKYTKHLDDVKPLKDSKVDSFEMDASTNENPDSYRKRHDIIDSDLNDASDEQVQYKVEGE